MRGAPLGRTLTAMSKRQLTLPDDVERFIAERHRSGRLCERR